MLSILIPTYNYNASPLVDSLLRQGKLLSHDFEIICCDDCSTDERILAENATIASKACCTYFRNSKNEGRTKTRTLLAEKAQYDWLLFLDADVLPVAEDFIKNYTEIPYNNKNDVIFGGYCYENVLKDPATILRWKFGKSRESHSETVRNLNPYLYLFSGNLMIKKAIFFKVPFPKTNHYGMDIYFSYYLSLIKARVYHINNPILHLGLEKNEIFFSKSLESVRIRKNFSTTLTGISSVNTLLKHYSWLKKYHLQGLVKIGFQIIAPLLKKNILGKNPNLFFFDIYRLGYICFTK